MISRRTPIVVGSILIGADVLVGEMVKSRIAHMRGQDWGPYTALGVVRRGKLVGGVVYHGYRGFDVQISAAFDQVGWALPGTLRALGAYPFLDLKVQRVSVLTGRKNKQARKLLRDLGFKFVGVAKRGLDGSEDAFIFEMLKENCKWLEDRAHEISAPQAPPPPDPYRVAGAQTGQNVQSAIASSYLGNVDQVGPHGSTTYKQGGTYTMTGPDGQTHQVPRFIQNTTLAPEQQKLYDQQTQLGTSLNNLALSQTQRLADHLGKPIDFSGLPDISNDFSADRSRVEQAMFDRVAGQNQRDYNALENRLTNQGFMRGTQAFTDAMDEHRRGINDQKLAITARGLAEQQGLYGMASNRRSQAMQEMLQARNQPINEIAALMGGGQVHLPGAQAYQGGNIGAADVAGNVYNTAALQQKQYEQQMAQHNQHLAGMYGLGQAAIGGGARVWGGRA